MSINNLDKLFQYFHCVSTSPIIFDGQYLNGLSSNHINRTVIGDQINSIKLNKNFFLNDTCENCGCCCPPESNVYSKSEYEKILNISSQEIKEHRLDPSYREKLQEKLKQENFIINEKVVPVYVYQLDTNYLKLKSKEKEIKRCSWCFNREDKFMCRIHNLTSITCKMPHLRIFHVNGKHCSSIGISQFGRNWALGCPVVFSEPKDESQFEYNKKNRIDKLQHLNDVGNDLNIETYLPKVIDYIQENINFNNYKNHLNIDILKFTKVTKLFPLYSS